MKRYNHAAALFMVFWSDIAGCFLFNQDPVCPRSNPACLNDHDPTIWNPNGGDIYKHGGVSDGGRGDVDDGGRGDASGVGRDDVGREAAVDSK